MAALTKKQTDKLKEHSKHQTTKHMASMRKDMRKGMSFSKSHIKAKKKVGV